MYIWLVALTILNNMKVSWDYDIPNKWKYKTCSKPPTSIYIYTYIHTHIYIYIPVLVKCSLLFARSPLMIG